MERLHDALNIFLTLQYFLNGRYIFFIFEYKMCLIAYEKTNFNPSTVGSTIMYWF